MAVYREGYHIIKLIEAKSETIYSDACDYGVPTKKGDDTWNLAKQAFDIYGEKETRKENRYDTGRSVEAIISLMDEWAISDEHKTKQEATDKFLIHFVSCTTGACKGYDGYIYIQKL